MADLVPPPDNRQSSDKLLRIIEDAERSLQEIAPSLFSEPAFARLREKVSEHVAQLISESIRVSKRHRADTVSTSDVEQASRHLVSSTSHKVFKHLGTVGGILLGAGVSNMLSMLTTNQFNITGIVLSFVLAVVGTFMVAAHIAKD